jgi:excisionase family DNA binding protein
VALLTIKQTAQRVGVSKRTIEHWVFKRQIAFIHVGRWVRISSEIIAEMIKRDTTSARKSPKQKSTGERAT